MQESRSHTDTLTNVVVLSEWDLRRHFGEIIQRDLPIATLATFLHETTHHWCLDTPVGLALHLLFMRARRSAFSLLSSEAQRDGGWDALDNVVRYEVTRDLTRPLSEGIALFAEHDAIPGHARTISTPMVRAAGLYGRGYAIAGDTPYDGIPVILAASRVSRRHVRRKAGLLLEPMTAANGGYLPGYLLVKALWRFAYAESDLFRDSDFFLQYLRSHFFEDWALVARLLDDTKKDIGAVDPIADHVSTRVRQFVETAIKDDHAREFETQNEDNQYDVLQIRTDLVAFDLKFLPSEESTEVSVGRSRFKKAFADYFSAWTGNDAVDALLDQDRAELVQRSVVNLGQLTVHGQAVAGGLRLSAGGEPLATVSAARLPADKSIDGVLDLELLSFDEPGGLCFTLTQDNALLCTVPIGSADLSDLQKRTLEGRDTRTDRVVLSSELIDAALSRADARTTLTTVRESLRNSLRRALDDWLLPIALMDVDAARLPEIREKTRTRGLLEVFGGDHRLLLDAAVASICIPSPYDFGSVEDFHQWTAQTPQSAIANVSAHVVHGLGFMPFVVSDKGTFERVSFI